MKKYKAKKAKSETQLNHREKTSEVDEKIDITPITKDATLLDIVKAFWPWRN